MKCYLCKEKIKFFGTNNWIRDPNDSSKDGYVDIAEQFFTIEDSYQRQCKLYLHKNCFSSVAGEDMEMVLDDAITNNYCLFCLENKRQQKNLLCSDCSDKNNIVCSGSPTKPMCGMKMILRYSNKTKKTFFGCVDFPRCVGTINF